MRKLGPAAVVLLGIALAVAWWARQSGPSVPDHVPARGIVDDRGAVEPAPRGRLPEPPDGELLAAARELLGADARVERCGPYPLHTDVGDARAVAACGRLASRLDDLYEERFGLRPRGEPAEAIVLFAAIEDYRRFAREGGVPLGYAGYALPARGLAVFYLGDQPFATFLTTLAHELTHLVHRRALGTSLPPWLSEGLADAVGDTATADGYRPLAGVAGSEAQAERLRRATAAGRAGGLERLVSLTRGEFDDAVVAFDYEQSAMFVRFLLGDPDLAAGFRGFLRDYAGGEPYSPERLADALGADWLELDRRFSAWLQATG